MLMPKETRDSTEEPSNQRVLPSGLEELPEIVVPYRYVDLISKLGLHYYNMQKGTNFQFSTVHESKMWITSIYSLYIVFEAVNQVDNSSCDFETLVRHAVEHRDCMSAITTHCRLKPQTPEQEEEEEDGLAGWWDDESVDNFFKGDMPNWIMEEAVMGSDKLQYYEMEEEKEWLHLYAELALFSKWQIDLEAMANAKPFEIKKIIVRTKDVESKKKVEAENAIFYISFKTRCGRDCNAIIRKTTDGFGHFSLEVKCLL